MATPNPGANARAGASVSVYLFLLFFLLGSGYIIVAKLFALHPGVVTFVPVGIMLLYALLARLLRGFSMRNDQTGDNCYYLGFLYTLTSLGMSLYQFDETGAGEQIIQNFGIAIGSTIAGVALRVLFHQMRHDPEDVEASSRMALAESARRVRRELDSTVREMAYFRRVSQQQVSEGFLEVQQDIDRVCDKLVNTIDTLQKRYQKSLNDTSNRSALTLTDFAKRNNETLSESARVLGDQQHHLQDSTRQLLAALDAVSERLQRMRSPDDAIEISLRPFVEDLGELIREVSRQSDEATQIQREIRDLLKERSNAS